MIFVRVKTFHSRCKVSTRSKGEKFNVNLWDLRSSIALHVFITHCQLQWHISYLLRKESVSATVEALPLCFLSVCMFIRGSFISELEVFIQWKHGYRCAVFVHLGSCVFPRGVGLPVVRMFLPVGQFVESHPGHQRDPHGCCTRHCGLLVLLYCHLGERLTFAAIPVTFFLMESLQLKVNS